MSPIGFLFFINFQLNVAAVYSFQINVIEVTRGVLWLFLFVCFFFWRKVWNVVTNVTTGLEKAVEIWDDVICVVAFDEALAAVVNEPAVDVGAALLLVAIVLLPAPKNTQTRFFQFP